MQELISGDCWRPQRGGALVSGCRTHQVRSCTDLIRLLGEMPFEEPRCRIDRALFEKIEKQGALEGLIVALRGSSRRRVVT